MAGPKPKISKNNAENRGPMTVLRVFGSRVVEPVKYVGSIVGHGNYIAARFQDDGTLVCDTSGKPLPYETMGFPK